MKNWFSEKIPELKWSHVISPEYLITACLNNNHPNYFLTENTDIQKKWWLVFIDYSYAEDYSEKNTSNYVSRDRNSYVISLLDSKNKYSLDYRNCTWIVAIWKSKETWKNISILTHQNPQFLVFDDKNSDIFKKDFWEKLLELERKSQKWTIDIVILWWNNNYEFEEYTKSFKKLSEIVNEIMGFNPIVIWEPSINKENNTGKGIFLDTENRQLHYYKLANDKNPNKDIRDINKCLYAKNPEKSLMELYGIKNEQEGLENEEMIISEILYKIVKILSLKVLEK